MSQSNLQHAPPMLLVYPAVLIGVVVLTGFGFSTRNPFLVGAMATIPFLILLLNRLDLWLMCVMIVMNANLRPPGLFGRIELVHLLLFGLIGVLLAKKTIIKQSYPKEGLQWGFMLIFLVVLLGTIAARGSGFRFLGDTRWGGMRYVGMMLTLTFLFFIQYITLKPRQWMWALAGMGLFGTLGFLADSLFILSQGRLYQQYFFFMHGGGVMGSLEAAAEGGLTRFQSAGSAAVGVVMIPFILFEYKARNMWKIVTFVVLALILAGLSGHRLALFTVVAIAWSYAFLMAKGRRSGFIAMSAVAGLLLLSLSIAFVRVLPLSFQRSMAMIPFIDVDPEAAMSAMGTSTWRFTVWRNAIYEVPEYLWLGKGYTYDQAASEAMRLLPKPQQLLEWPRLMVAYHNGPLSLLIGLGLAGFLAGLGFLLTSTARHLKLTSQKEKWRDPTLLRLHNVISIIYLINTIRFLFIYGDAYVSLPIMFIKLAILEGLWYSNMEVQPDTPIETPAPVTQLSPKARRPFNEITPLPVRSGARQALPFH